MRKLLLGALAALILAAGPGLASAATPAGTATGVDPQANAAGGGGSRTLIVGADIFKGDVVKTGPAGQVEIIFSDDTHLVVGPNSSLEIQDYLFRNDGTAKKLAVDVLAGTFRFITGNSPHDAYKINTPTGTIAVRGTGFDGFIDENGVAHIIMYVGETELCDKNAKLCKILGGLCQVGEIGQGDTTVIGSSKDLTADQRKALRDFFIYANNQTPLSPDFRLPNTFDCLHKPPPVLTTSASTGTAVEEDHCDWEEGEGG